MERLMSYFVPQHYKLKFDINKKTEKVLGEAVIRGRQVDKSCIKLHGKGLKISEVLVNGDEMKFELVKAEDSLLIFHEVREAEDVEIKINYEFKINHNMEGVYLSTFDVRDTGEKMKMVTTQFESHYAREAFPCVDEPEAKAKFALTIMTDDEEDTVLSNMPVKKREGREVIFEETPRMSTYLLAFVVGHLNHVETKNKHGVTVSTYGTLGQPVSALEFSNKIAADALDLYDDVFGVPYPLPKLDQVAIPDFEAGAMENWGLVTYREACLLADKNTSKSEKEYIATVVTHELSHQWFGNLVTMKWWDDLWLNESFANMMQYFAADRLHPEWNVWEDFFTQDCFHALSRDALPGVQAVQQPVNDPAEIATLFDSAIVYAKGSHLMFMLMRLMGEEAFFKGLHDYFIKYAYTNTTGNDLWLALDKYADFDVKKFMNVWIAQPGYPLITDGAQQRFLITGATDDSKWPFPEVRDDMSGHYILNLSAVEFEEKLERFDELSLEQRLRLLIDRMLLARTPLVSSGSLMDLLPKFAKETSEPVWEILSDIIGLLKVFCPPDTEYYPLFQKYVFGLIEYNLKRLGLETRDSEDDSETKLRNIILSYAIYAEDDSTLEKLAEKYNSDFCALDSETRSAIILGKFRYDKESIFDELLERYTRENDPSIKSDLLSIISTAREEKHVFELISLLEKPEVVRPQDHIYLLAYLLTNFYTRGKGFKWFYTHWDYIISLTSDKSLDDYIRIVAARIRTEEEYEEFLEFVKPLEKKSALARGIDVAKTDILARLRWIETDKRSVYKRLK